jgi:DNA polymerase-3 subunit beta
MLRISATNLEIGVFVKIGAKIEKDGKITAPAKLISSFVNNLSGNDVITVEVRDQVLHLTTGKHVAKIKGLSAQDFPIIPEMDGNFHFSWSGKEIKDIFPKLLTSVSVDATRPELSGVNVLFSETETFLASTDSFRLTEVALPLKQEGKRGFEILRNRVPAVIIPANTLAEVWRTVDATTENVRVYVEESQIFFQIDGVRIVSRLINGKYPEYKQIMPQQFETTVFIDREELLRSTRIAGFFTQSKSGEVVFRVCPSKKRLVIEARSEDKGENTAELLIEGDGPDQEVVFNPRYILDGINTVSSPELALLLNDASSPVAIRSVGGQERAIRENFTYIIMPIRK